MSRWGLPFKRDLVLRISKVTIVAERTPRPAEVRGSLLSGVDEHGVAVKVGDGDVGRQHTRKVVFLWTKGSMDSMLLNEVQRLERQNLMLQERLAKLEAALNP